MACSPFVKVSKFLRYNNVKQQLKHICRETIRKHLLDLDRHEILFCRIPRIGLPLSLTSYLLFEASLEIIDSEDIDVDDDDNEDLLAEITVSEQCKTR